MLSKIEILEKEIKKLREQLVVGKEKARAPGPDTSVEAMDSARKGEILHTLCVAYAKKLAEARFKVCAIDNTLRGTQTKMCEVITLESIEDVATTQEPTTYIAKSTESNQAMDT